MYEPKGAFGNMLMNDRSLWTDEDLKTLILVYEQMVEDLGKKKASPKK
jgi:hypothetical protein